MAKVSVLMNCYNGEKYLRESIQSVYQQTFQDWEIVFVDNCSTDTTAEIAQSFDSRLKYHRTPQFMSLCQARVWARPLIQGTYFSVLDSDDLLLPTKLEKQVQVLDSRPEVGIVYANSQFFSDQGDTKVYYDHPMPSGNIFPKLFPNYFFSLETLMARKSIMDQHNIYFDEKYNIASDAELFIKLSYFTESYYIDEVLAKWRHGHVSESVRQFVSFPKEYEILLADLRQIIPEFEDKYAHEIRILQSRVNNMYGMGFWQNGDKKTAKDHFRKASALNKKYLVPLVLMHVLKFDTYKKLRGLTVKA